MNPRKRELWLIGTMLALLLLTVLWSYGQMSASKEAVLSAAQDTAQCRHLADRIGQLQHKPSLAGSSELAMTELARLIEQAAAGSEIPGGSLVRITPEAARRIGDSVYKEKPTQVLLRNVTLGQIVRFLHSLTGNDSGLEARQIRLSAPRDQQTGDQWVLEATLGYLIYAPATPLKEQSR